MAQRRIDALQRAEAKRPDSPTSPKRKAGSPRSRALVDYSEGRTTPGSYRATKGAIESGQAAMAKASDNESVYWSMKDFEGGYSLFGSRRVFHFEVLNVAVLVAK